MLLVDDSLENALACTTSTPSPVPVLLFGAWPWNKRRSLMRPASDSSGSIDYLSFDQREALGVVGWRDDEVKDDDLPVWVQRARTWADVVQAARAYVGH